MNTQTDHIWKQPNRKQEDEENGIMSSFVISTFHQIVLGGINSSWMKCSGQAMHMVEMRHTCKHFFPKSQGKSLL
jgi:hypothetical protein